MNKYIFLFILLMIGTLGSKAFENLESLRNAGMPITEKLEIFDVQAKKTGKNLETGLKKLLDGFEKLSKINDWLNYFDPTTTGGSRSFGGGGGGFRGR